RIRDARRQQDDRVDRPPDEIRSRPRRRPVRYPSLQVQVAHDDHREHHALDDHHRRRRPPEQAAVAEPVGRHLADVERDAMSRPWPAEALAKAAHDTLSRAVSRPVTPRSRRALPFVGQNHPTSVMNTGIAPQTTPCAWKIDHTNMTLVAIAARNGHSDGPGIE